MINACKHSKIIGHAATWFAIARRSARYWVIAAVRRACAPWMQLRMSLPSCRRFERFLCLAQHVLKLADKTLSAGVASQFTDFHIAVLTASKIIASFANTVQHPKPLVGSMYLEVQMIRVKNNFTHPAPYPFG